VTCYSNNSLVGTFFIPTNRLHPISALKKLIKRDVGLDVTDIRPSFQNLSKSLEDTKLVGNETVFTAYGTLVPSISTSLESLKDYNVTKNEDTIKVSDISWQTLQVLNERLKTEKFAIIELRVSDKTLNNVLAVLKERESVQGLMITGTTIETKTDRLINELIASRPFKKIGFTGVFFPTGDIFDTLRHATIEELIWKDCSIITADDVSKKHAIESIAQITIVNHSIKNVDIDDISKKIINRERQFELYEVDEKHDHPLKIGGTIFNNCPTIFYLKPTNAPDFPIVLLFKDEKFIRLYDEVKVRQNITKIYKTPICVGKVLPYLEIKGTPGQVPQSLFITFDGTANEEHVSLAEMVKDHPTIRWLPLRLFRNEKSQEKEFLALMKNVKEGNDQDSYMLTSLIGQTTRGYQWTPYQFAETLFNFLKPNSILFERIRQQNGANYIVKDYSFWQKMYGRLLSNFLSDHPIETTGYLNRFVLKRVTYTQAYVSLFDAIIHILSVVCLIADILPKKTDDIAALVSGYLPDPFINLVIEGLVYTQSYQLTQVDDLSVDLESHIKKIQENRPPPIPNSVIPNAINSPCIIA